FVGIAADFAVTAHDAFGNTATGYRGTVSFTSSDNLATLLPTYSFVTGDQGVHRFTATLFTTGTQSLVGEDNAAGLSASEGNITINNLVPILGSLSASTAVENAPAQSL